MHKLTAKQHKRYNATRIQLKHVYKSLRKETVMTRKATESADIESNVNENFKVIQNPGFLPDHPQN